MLPVMKANYRVMLTKNMWIKGQKKYKNHLDLASSYVHNSLHNPDCSILWATQLVPPATFQGFKSHRSETKYHVFFIETQWAEQIPISLVSGTFHKAAQNVLKHTARFMEVSLNQVFPEVTGQICTVHLKHVQRILGSVVFPQARFLTTLTSYSFPGLAGISHVLYTCFKSMVWTCPYWCSQFNVLCYMVHSLNNAIGLVF